DVYHTHFSTGGALIVAYGFFRCVFTLYLFWIAYGVGAPLLRIVAGPSWSNFTTPERLALGFFTGTGVWHVVLLGLGYLGLYTIPVAIGLTLPAIVCSFPGFSALVREISARLTSWPKVFPRSLAA